MSQAKACEVLSPVMTFLCREDGGYSPQRHWASFDTLHVRTIDDLFFASDVAPKIVCAFASEPPHSADVAARSIPTQIALERFFFHIAEPDILFLNPQSIPEGAPIPQQGISFSMSANLGASRRIGRSEVPEIIGALSIDPKAMKDPIAHAERAFRRGAFFESFYLARVARLAGGADSGRAWFFELFSSSFFGAAEDALALYEEYPDRGSSEPMAQLLAARYRLLLKQFNEARTILHTLSFHEELAVVALCELARSFVIEKEFTRAIDTATAAIEKDKSYAESFLVRGIAHRAIAYDAGDADGLREALADFERVAKHGAYGSAEATYHAGTVFARLGALVQAELAFRQSLFQRDRLSARDALIRVLCAAEKRAEAAQELLLLEQIAPRYGAALRADIGSALHEKSNPGDGSKGAGSCSELWASDPEEIAQAAQALLGAWGVPVTGEPADFVVIDDLINRFAPDGDFPAEGRFSALRMAGNETVVRALAGYVGSVLVRRGLASWGTELERSITLITERDATKIPVESFIAERLLLGASGDNLSSIESLAVGLVAEPSLTNRPPSIDWWSGMPAPVLERYALEAEWARASLRTLGVTLTGALGDFEKIDALIDQLFAPGGALQEAAPQTLEVEIDRWIGAVGLLIGEVVSSYIECSWSEHEKPEGISLYNSELGRIFPIAKLQRRVYLASAADFASKLGSLAWAVAVAAVTEGIRKGRYQGAPQVREALVTYLPTIAQFPEGELAGVVDSLLIGATLK
jgi:tetratricopeptide (TPR) repeat protein